MRTFDKRTFYALHKAPESGDDERRATKNVGQVDRKKAKKRELEVLRGVNGRFDLPNAMDDDLKTKPF